LPLQKLGAKGQIPIAGRTKLHHHGIGLLPELVEGCINGLAQRVGFRDRGFHIPRDRLSGELSQKAHVGNEDSLHRNSGRNSPKLIEDQPHDEQTKKDSYNAVPRYR
jgi:hypothetical protein